MQIWMLDRNHPLFTLLAHNPPSTTTAPLTPPPHSSGPPPTINQAIPTVSNRLHSTRNHATLNIHIPFPALAPCPHYRILPSDWPPPHHHHLTISPLTTHLTTVSQRVSHTPVAEATFREQVRWQRGGELIASGHVGLSGGGL